MLTQRFIERAKPAKDRTYKRDKNGRFASNPVSGSKQAEKPKNLGSEARKKIDKIYNKDKKEIEKMVDEESKIKKMMVKDILDKEAGLINETEYLSRIQSKTGKAMSLRKKIGKMKEGIREKVLNDVVYVDNPLNPERTKKAVRSLGFAEPEMRDRLLKGLKDFSKMVDDDLWPKEDTIIGENGVTIRTDPVVHTFGKSGRAGVNSIRVEMSLYENSGASTVVHELAHVLEDISDDQLKKSIKFRNDRNGNKKPEKYSDGKMLLLTDDFDNRYAGAMYQVGSNKGVYAKTVSDPKWGDSFGSEILSVGMEEMYLDPVQFAESDPDYFDFVYNSVRGNDYESTRSKKVSNPQPKYTY